MENLKEKNNMNKMKKMKEGNIQKKKKIQVERSRGKD
jgi:hypothetical protein